MNLFHKKKLVFLLLLILLLVVSFVVILSLLLLNTKKHNKTIETLSWSIQKKTIILDAGHGLPDTRSI